MSETPGPVSLANQGLATPQTAQRTDNGRFIRRLGPHHFAYLRAIAEGLDGNASAQRYLGTTHGHERKTAHRQLVDTVQAIARRAGERSWRLVGLTIRSIGSTPQRPTLEAFIEERGLDGWSEDEQLDMLEAAYPVDKRSAKRDRLRLKQLEMLRRLEHTQAQAPRPHDLVSDWFDDLTAAKLITAGHNTLHQLALVIATGGQWYRTMPGVGVTKAGRIASHLLTLIPAALPPEKPFFALKHQGDSTPADNRSPDDSAIGRLPHASVITLPSPSNRLSQVTTDVNAAVTRSLPERTLLDAQTDAEAVEAWIRARCSSAATIKSYTREARRLMLWLIRERSGLRFAEMRVEDCLAYQAFLQHIPPGWISRNRVTPGYIGWAPFRGPLTTASQHQAIKIVGALFAWLAAARYVQGNPWMLINTDTAQQDQTTVAIDTKSISEVAMQHIHQFLAAQPPSPAVHRMRFVLTFVESVGLRSAEVINAKLGDFSLQPEGWTLRVTGKGSKTRTVFVPRPAFDALQTYLFSRGVGGIETAPSDAPLLASTHDGMTPIGYQALYLTVKRWLRKAVSASGLSLRERNVLDGASTHWLRHTFGTRAVAREVPYDVIQQQLGHASVTTTMNIYARAPLRRRAAELGKAFG